MTLRHNIYNDADWLTRSCVLVFSNITSFSGWYSFSRDLVSLSNLLWYKDKSVEVWQVLIRWITGRTFDLESRGWLILSEKVFIFSTRSAEKFISRYTKDTMLIFNQANIWRRKKNNKNKTKQNIGVGKGVGGASGRNGI